MCSANVRKAVRKPVGHGSDKVSLSHAPRDRHDIRRDRSAFPAELGIAARDVFILGNGDMLLLCEDAHRQTVTNGSMLATDDAGLQVPKNDGRRSGRRGVGVHLSEPGKHQVEGSRLFTHLCAVRRFFAPRAFW